MKDKFQKLRKIIGEERKRFGIGLILEVWEPWEKFQKGLKIGNP